MYSEVQKKSDFFVNEKISCGASKKIRNAHFGKAVGYHLDPSQTGLHYEPPKHQVFGARKHSVVHLVGAGNNICRTPNALKTS